jgi:hypothetical protein
LITQEAGRGNATMAPAAGDLARMADELLHEVQELRRRYEELSAELARAQEDAPQRRGATRSGPDSQESLHSLALQMAFAGRTREQAKAELRELGAPDGDRIVDEVYGRSDAGWPESRRRRFFRRR